MSRRPAGGRPWALGPTAGWGNGEGLFAGAPGAVEAEVGRLRVRRVVPVPGEAHVGYRASLRDPVPAADRHIDAALEHLAVARLPDGLPVREREPHGPAVDRPVALVGDLQAGAELMVGDAVDLVRDSAPGRRQVVVRGEEDVVGQLR